MAETRVGTVTHYYNHIHVAGVMITDGELREGDTIHVKGHTSDFEQKVESMQIDHEAVEVAKPGDQIGLTVIEHAREHDAVYMVN
jgi:translation elongation factor EF-1alpha